MAIGAIVKTSTSQNGLKTFILPLRRLDFHYCDRSGSSQGMNRFLKHMLPAFAARHPGVEMHVSPRPCKHPLVRGYFVNGAQKAVCVRNLEKEQILDKVELLRDNSGLRNRRERRKVISANESVRGVWSPFHRPGGVLPWRI